MCAGNQIKSFRQRIRKLGGAKQLIDGSEKRIWRLSLNFRVRMLLKGAVTENKHSLFSVNSGVTELHICYPHAIGSLEFGLNEYIF